MSLELAEPLVRSGVGIVANVAGQRHVGQFVVLPEQTQRLDEVGLEVVARQQEHLGRPPSQAAAAAAARSTVFFQISKY